MIPCPLCGASVPTAEPAELDGLAAIRLWDATAAALNAAPPRIRIVLARAIERASRGWTHEQLTAWIAGQLAAGATNEPIEGARS